MIEKKIAAGDARAEFATLINEVAFAKTRTILTRRGRDIAAIIPIEDFNLIRRLEDRIDSEKLAARKNESTSPLAAAARRLGLEIPTDPKEEKAVKAKTRKARSPRG